MYPSEKLPEIFDVLVNKMSWESLPPTENSIEKINSHFNMKLPQSLINFALKSNNFSGWFSGLGEDYQSTSHIIRVNSLYRQKRMRREGKWVKSMPRNYVIINLGFDEDCDCIDIDTFNPDTGEYNIKYWSPGIEDGAVHEDFYNYINSHLMFWSKDIKGEKLSKINEILSA